MNCAETVLFMVGTPPPGAAEWTEGGVRARGPSCPPVPTHRSWLTEKGANGCDNVGVSQVIGVPWGTPNKWLVYCLLL